MRSRLLFVLYFFVATFCGWPTTPGNTSDLETTAVQQLRTLAQEIESLDAILTTSALTFAFTEDDRWLDVYNQNEARLGALLENALSHARDSDTALLKHIDEENDLLVEMEVRAIELTQKGEGRKAAEILNSKQYQEGKLRLRQSMDAYFLSLEERLLPKGNQDQDYIDALLTEAEKSWIKTNPTIRVNNESDWPPFNFAVNGKPKGYSIDFMNLLAKKSGLEVEYVTGPAWNEFMGMMRRGELDVLLNIIRTPEREKHLLFTNSYASNPNVILSRRKTPYDSLEQLRGKTVAVPKGFYQEEILKRDYPGIIVHTEKNVLDSMNAVAVGKADAVVGEVAIFNYLMNEHTMFGLALSTPVKIGDFDTSRLAIATGKAQPYLHSILQKAMSTVTTEEKTTLLKRWMGEVNDGNSGVPLTAEERQWLVKHEGFSLGVDPSWAPFEFIDTKGVYSGIGSSYVDMIGTRLGVTLTPETGLSWAAVLEKVRAGEIDILPTVARTPEREKYLNFSKPYISFPMVITTRKDAPFVDSLAGLEGKKVGVVKGYITQELIETNQKGIHVVPVKTLSEGLMLLNNGKIDAFIDNLLTITHEIDRANLDDLKIASPTKYKFELSMAVRKGLPELVPIIDKALGTINEQERAAIVNSWTAIQISYGVDTRTILLWGAPLVIGAIIVLLIVIFWARFIQKQKRIIQQREADIVREKEALEAVMDTVDYGILFMDPDLKARIMNRAYRELWDIDDDIATSEPTVEDLIRYNQGKGYYDVADEDFDEFVLARVNSIRKGSVAPIEVRQPNGRILSYQCLALPDGRRMLTYLDITERSNMEAALRDSEVRARSAEEQLSFVFENMTEGLVFYDAEQRLVFCNSKYRDFYKYDENDLTPGTRFEDLVRLDVERGTVVANAAQEQKRIDFRRQNSNESLEIELSDGRWLQVRESTTAEGTISIATDVTERKNAEREVEARRAQLDDILSNITQGVVMFDSEQRMIAWNDRYPDILNLEENFLQPGLSLYELVLHLSTRGSYGDGDPEALARQRVRKLWTGEHRSDASFGDERSFDAQSMRTPDGGLVITYSDITERKKSEHIIAKAMTLINESIQYASRIQRSVLPVESELKQAFADHFIIWQPKDVVGGDIYLLRTCNGGQLIFLIDCTGHGVPGAFMAMIATGAFDQALIEIPDGNPAVLLQRANQLVKKILGQDGHDGESDDGFECGVCLIDNASGEITFAGARFELWQLDGQEFTVTKGDKAGIGYRRTEAGRSFTNHVVPVIDGATYYMTTDGLIDQVGGKKYRAFGKRRLKGVILDYSKMKMSVQAAQIIRAFEEYQHNEERRDDISLVGFKLKN
jgi:ABC-type amino acid transport substrate-binding protein/serine phosphatase RsbU (regulator of sigma subunit)